MSIFNRLSRSEIHQNYTHYGWFAGFIPVYVKNADSDNAEFTERNWVPEWIMDTTSNFYEWAGIMPSLLITGDIK